MGITAALPGTSPTAPIVELAHVDIARGSRTVLHDIHLTVHPGEHIAILGPNGCGKSTLIKTLTRELYPVVHAAAKPPAIVRLFGRERWDLTELRRHLGLVSPDLPGKPILTTTGRDAVLTGFFSSSTLWPNLTVTPEMQHRADEVLTLVDAHPIAHRLVGEMSAGQQRRILIARALVTSAGTLLLDEPSNALDLAAQRDLQSLLRTLARQGTTILLITHHLPDIIPEVDRILLMRDGRIVADGTKPDVLTAPTLSTLFNTPVTLTERDGLFHAS